MRNSHDTKLSARNKYNIPVIIKISFWADDSENPKAVYVCFSFPRLIKPGCQSTGCQPQVQVFVASYRVTLPVPV